MSTWSSDAPILADGKSWEQEQTTQGAIQALFHMHWRASVARLANNQMGINLYEWCTRGSSANASWFQPPNTFTAAVFINGESEGEESLTAGKQTNGITWYWSGIVPSGVTVVIQLKDGTSDAVTIPFTAPDELITRALWKKHNGVWVKIANLT